MGVWGRLAAPKYLLYHGCGATKSLRTRDKERFKVDSYYEYDI